MFGLHTRICAALDFRPNKTRLWLAHTYASTATQTRGQLDRNWPITTQYYEVNSIISLQRHIVWPAHT